MKMNTIARMADVTANRFVNVSDWLQLLFSAPKKQRETHIILNRLNDHLWDLQNEIRALKKDIQTVSTRHVQTADLINKKVTVLFEEIRKANQ
ncbi:hypothetical protein [Piscirickettsia salmonis]|uniref:hypothetical protein n=1 Tax=Piscirickettsia salmonis TaxID=1238 RepID=UPI0012BAE8D4|nr:hypothetical protein [Piscirickettsia salmonis]QGP41375.1 hypothetical protein Psal182_03585 [Piscirickettsia salmonis]